MTSMPKLTECQAAILSAIEADGFVTYRHEEVPGRRAQTDATITSNAQIVRNFPYSSARIVNAVLALEDGGKECIAHTAPQTHGNARIGTVTVYTYVITEIGRKALAQHRASK